MQNWCKLVDVIQQVLHIESDNIMQITMRNTQNWDSMRHIDLMMALEDTFNLEKLLPAEITTMTTVSIICDVLRSRGINV